MKFEQTPQDNSANTELSENTTLDKLREKPIYKRVKRMLVYLAVSSSIVLAMELQNKFAEAPKKDLQEEVEKNKMGLSAEEIEKFQEQRAYIEQNIGHNVLPFLAQRHIKEQENSLDRFDIEGAEKVGVKDSTLQLLWSEGDHYPKGWIDNEVDHIKLTNFSEIDAPVYTKEDQEMAGGTRGNTMQLTAMKDVPENEKLKTLDWVFSHESGHLNDWENDSDAKFHERVDLLASVHQRMGKKDRFEDIISGYDDMDMIENEEQRQFYLAREYWGSICEYYFTFPQILKDKYPNDFELVDEWVKKNDPDFDPFVASEKRNNFMEQE